MINHVSFKKDTNGKFVDVFDVKDVMRITDYCCIDKEILIQDSEVKIGDKKRRNKVTNLSDLKKWAELFIEVAIQILNTENVDCRENEIDCIINEQKAIDNWSGSKKQIESRWEDRNVIYRKWNLKISIDENEKQLLVEQLVFDMLWDFYLSHSPELTLPEYVKQLAGWYGEYEIENKTFEDAKRKKISYGMKEYYEKLNISEVQEELKVLGLDGEKYAKYYKFEENTRNNKRPKFIWDQLFYNREMITAKQYRRQCSRKNRNYSYEEIYEDFQEYKKFLEKVLPGECDYGNRYMNKAMSYYALESYKRIDFISKLATDMFKLKIEKEDEVKFLIKRFHPQVMVPYVDNGIIKFGNKCKYYRPLLMIVALLQKRLANDDKSYIGQKLINCQIIRAKVYELLKYHIELVSFDEKECEEFLRKSYNVYTYYKENEAWKLIGNEAWKNKSKEEKAYLKNIFNKFIEINAILFK